MLTREEITASYLIIVFDYKYTNGTTNTLFVYTQIAIMVILNQMTKQRWERQEKTWNLNTEKEQKLCICVDFEAMPIGDVNTEKRESIKKRMRWSLAKYYTKCLVDMNIIEQRNRLLSSHSLTECTQ